MKKLSLIMAVLMVLTAMSVMLVAPTSAAWDGTSVSTSLKGSGTAADPYIVATPEDLAYLSAKTNAGEFGQTESTYVKQTADIDLGGKPFTPISNASGETIAGWVHMTAADLPSVTSS